MKLTLCAIAKDEQEGLPLMFASVKDYVDQFVLLDTGSGDKTMEVARELGAEVYERPWDNSFANARNAAMDHCTGDWILSLDCDEQMEPESASNLCAAIETLPEGTKLAMPVMVMCQDDGTPYQEFLCERIIKNGIGIRWDGDMHNWVDTPVDDTRVALPNIRILHNRGVKPKERRTERSQQRVEMAESIFKPRIEADPKDRRSLFYLAGTYHDAGRQDEAIEWYEKYLPVSDWAEERYQAAMLLADLYRQKGRRADARKLAYAHLCDNWRRAELLIVLGEIAYQEGDFAQARWWFQAASLKEKPVDPMFVEVAAHTWGPHMGLYQVYTATGNRDQALKHAEIIRELGGPAVGGILKKQKNEKTWNDQKIACLVDRGQMDFIQPLIDHWRNNGKEVRITQETAEIPDLNEWADIVWCEWGGPVAAELTKLPKTSRIMVRLHGYEVYSGMLPAIDWSKVDDAIFVQSLLRDVARQQIPELDELCNTFVVEGGVDCEKFNIKGYGQAVPVLEHESGFFTLSDPRVVTEDYPDLLIRPEGGEPWSRPYEYEWVLSKIEPGWSVLDFGAGETILSEFIAAKDVSVTRSDIDDFEMEKHRRRNPTIQSLTTTPGADLGGPYDCVVSVSTLEHIPEPLADLRAIYKALKPGGALVMTFDVPRKNPSQVREDLCTAGFDVPAVSDEPPKDAIAGKAASRGGWDLCPLSEAGLTAYKIIATKPTGVRIGKRIAMACHLNARKNLPLALQVISAAPQDFTLHIAGEWQDGELKIYCENLIHELGLKDRVEFCSRVPDLAGWYADKDFYLCTSTRETFHYSLAEAMACGLKPVIHEWPGVQEFYDDAFVFQTVAEAVCMLKGSLIPDSYRQCILENWNQDRLLKRLDRIVNRPAVVVEGEPKYPDAMENKIQAALEQNGCIRNGKNPTVVIKMGHRLQGVIPGAKNVAWVTERIQDADEDSRARLSLYREALPGFDEVLVHQSGDCDLVQSFRPGKSVELLNLAAASPPFRPLGVKKEYDVGFYGVMSERRDRILKELGEEFEVVCYQDTDHEKLNLFINQCKVMVNIGYAYKWVPTVRIAECMAAGTCVVTEDLEPGHPFQSGFISEGETVAEFATEIRELLADDANRERMAHYRTRWIRRELSINRKAEELLDLVEVSK